MLLKKIQILLKTVLRLDFTNKICQMGSYVGAVILSILPDFNAPKTNPVAPPEKPVKMFCSIFCG